MVLNTAVAESLRQFYKELEGTPADKMEDAVHALVKRAVLKHKKVLFNGNGYTDEWVAESEKRGLYNLKSTPEALPCFTSDKNVELFTTHHIFTKQEIFSRYEILMENYCKTIHIEAKTLQDMIRRDFLPALMCYTDAISTSINEKTAAADLPCTAEKKLLTRLSGCYDSIFELEEQLEADTKAAEETANIEQAAKLYHDTILPDMEQLRAVADAAEEYIPVDILPYPNYEALLFSV